MLILTECRKAKNPVVKISNLIASFSGARLAEICEANKLDFVSEGENLVFYIRLENRAPNDPEGKICVDMASEFVCISWPSRSDWICSPSQPSGAGSGATAYR